MPCNCPTGSKREKCFSCNSYYCSRCHEPCQCANTSQPNKRRKVSSEDENTGNAFGNDANWSSSSTSSNYGGTSSGGSNSGFSYSGTSYNSSNPIPIPVGDPFETRMQDDEEKDTPNFGFDWQETSRERNIDGNNFNHYGIPEDDYRNNYDDNYGDDDDYGYDDYGDHDYGDDDEEFFGEENFDTNRNEQLLLASGEFGTSEGDSGLAVNSTTDYAISTNNSSAPLPQSFNVCPNGMHTSHQPTVNTIGAPGLEIGVATWNINHLSNLINLPEKEVTDDMSEEKRKTAIADNKRREKTRRKLATVKDVFLHFNWLDVLVLQEINLTSPQIIGADSPQLEYHSGPLMRVITKGKANQSGNGALWVNFKEKNTPAKLGQGEYYGIVMRKNGSVRYDKTQVFYNGQLRDVGDGEIFYWSKKFDTGKVKDDAEEVAINSNDAAPENVSVQDTQQAQRYLRDIDVDSLQKFRPIIIHCLTVGDKTVKIGIVHTSPKGKGFHRASVFSQVDNFFKLIATKTDEYWIVGGDYYLEPYATIDNDSVSYAPSEVGPQRKEETVEAFEARKKRLNDNLSKPPRIAKQKHGESDEEYKERREKAEANKEKRRKTGVTRPGERKLAETDQQYARRRKDHLVKMEDLKRRKISNLEKGTLLKNQFIDVISEKLKIAISVSATNQGSVTRQGVEKIKRDPKMFSGFYTCYLKDGEERYVNNSRADFFVCSRNFEFVYAGMLSPDGNKLLVADPNHNALNWWLDISDHTPIGCVFSVSKQSRKWNTVKADLFTAEHKTNVENEINSFRNRAFEKFFDSVKFIDIHLRNLQSYQQSNEAKETSSDFPDDENSAYLFVGAYYRLINTFRLLPRTQLPRSLADWVFSMPTEQLDMILSGIEEKIGEKEMHQFEEDCIKNKNLSYALRIAVKKASQALQTLSVTFTEELNREDMSEERKVNFNRPSSARYDPQVEIPRKGIFSFQDFDDVHENKNYYGEDEEDNDEDDY